MLFRSGGDYVVTGFMNGNDTVTAIFTEEEIEGKMQGREREDVRKVVPGGGKGFGIVAAVDEDGSFGEIFSVGNSGGSANLAEPKLNMVRYDAGFIPGSEIPVTGVTLPIPAFGDTFKVSSDILIKPGLYFLGWHTDPKSLTIDRITNRVHPARPNLKTVYCMRYGQSMTCI